MIKIGINGFGRIGRSTFRIAMRYSDEIEVDFSLGIIKNITKNCEYQAQGFPTFIEEIMKADGLVKQTRMNLSSNDKGK